MHRVLSQHKSNTPRQGTGAGRKGPRATSAPSSRASSSGDAQPWTSKRRDDRRSRKHAKRRRGDQSKPQAPARVVAHTAQAKPALDTDRAAEEPLTPQELSVMRQHLRFLREHRRVLQLRVNAQEDLLLNETRQPTRRGVCQHLLAKVDRARVFGAAERLEPAAATRLAEGVLRIAPDVDYLLLYLDCVRRSASQQQAVAALAEGLERIDFSQVSSGQMRRVLELIVELFNEQQRPQMLLGLLEGEAFRRAFDQFAAELPAAMAELLVPLRAVQAAVLHGRANPFGAAALDRGVELLLRGGQGALLRYPTEARRRLLQLGAQSAAATQRETVGALRALLGSFDDTSHEHGEHGVALARRWIGAGLESEARELLETLAQQHSGFRLPGRWLEALSAPRAGRIALLEPKALSKPVAPGRSGLRGAGMSLNWMRPVQLFVAAEMADEQHARWRRLVQSMTLPGVAPVLEEGQLNDGRPFVAVPRMGQRLSGLLKRKRGLGQEVALRMCAEAAVLLSALADQGVALPDAEPRRFELTQQDRLWLTDVSGARPGAADEVQTAHAQLAGQFVQRVLESARRFIAPAWLLERVRSAARVREVARALTEHLE